MKDWIDYLPPASVAYCRALQAETPFALRVTPARRTKHGDYRYRVAEGTHTISVNGTLRPAAFLFTLLHEVAHLRTYQRHRRAVRPHGRAWQQTFRALVEPVLTEAVFGPALPAVRAHLRAPRASSAADPALAAALYADPEAVTLGTLPEGATFRLRGRTFVRRGLRRTRVVCQEVGTSKQYLVPAAAEVVRLPAAAQ